MRTKVHLILPVLFATALILLLQHFLGSIAWAGAVAWNRYDNDIAA